MRKRKKDRDIRTKREREREKLDHFIPISLRFAFVRKVFTRKARKSYPRGFELTRVSLSAIRAPGGTSAPSYKIRS